jgi:hypothetical protein
MAVAFVQSRATNGSAVTSLALVYSSNNTAGNLLVYLTSCFDNAGNVVSAATDSNTNTIAQAGSNNNSAGHQSMRCDYVANCHSGANTVTAHDAVGTGEVFIHIWEISGCDTTSPVRDTGAVANSATASVSTSGSTSQTGDAVIAYFHSDSATFTFTVGSGYSHLTQTSSAPDSACSASEFKVATGSGTQTATISGNGTNALGQTISVFKQATATIPPVASWEQSGDWDPGIFPGNSVSY